MNIVEGMIKVRVINAYPADSARLYGNGYDKTIQLDGNSTGVFYVPSRPVMAKETQYGLKTFQGSTEKFFKSIGLGFGDDVVVDCNPGHQLVMRQEIEAYLPTMSSAHKGGARLGTYSGLEIGSNDELKIKCGRGLIVESNSIRLRKPSDSQVESVGGPITIQPHDFSWINGSINNAYFLESIEKDGFVTDVNLSIRDVTQGNYKDIIGIVTGWWWHYSPDLLSVNGAIYNVGDVAITTNYAFNCHYVYWQY